MFNSNSVYIHHLFSHISSIIILIYVAKTTIEFNAIAYPNPFENNFNINITSNLESSVRIRVYDMLGKLIEDTNVESTEISNYEIGNNYPSGVYNVIVSQGEYYANTRVIKR